MMLYKVTVPSRSPTGYVSHTALIIPSEHWMAALTRAVEEMGEDKEAVQNITWQIKNEDYVEVVAVDTKRIFVIERYYPEKDEHRATRTTDLDSLKNPEEELLPEDTSPDFSSAPRAFRPVDEGGSDAAIEEDEEELDEESRERVDTEQELPWVSREDKERVDLAEADTIDIGDDASQVRQELSDAQKKGEKKKKRERKAKKTEGDGSELLEEIYFDLMQLDELSADLPNLFETALDIVRSHIDCDLALVLLSEKSGRELYLAAAKGLHEDEAAKHKVPISDGFSGLCVREGKALISNNPQEEGLLFKGIPEKLTKIVNSVACAPVRHGARVYGVIELLNQNAGDFIQPELAALKVVAECIGEHIYNTIMSTELNHA